MKLANHIFTHGVFALALLVLTGCPGMPKMGGKGPGGGGPDGGGGCGKCNPKGKGGVPSASRKGPGQGDGVHNSAEAKPAPGNVTGDNGPASSSPGATSGTSGTFGVNGTNGVNGLVAGNGDATPTATPTGTSGGDGTAVAPGLPSTPAVVKLIETVDLLKPCTDPSSPLSKWAAQATAPREFEPDGSFTLADELAREFTTMQGRLAQERGVEFTLNPANHPDFKLLMGRAKGQLLRCLVSKGKDDALKALLDNGWDPNFKDKDGNTALSLAIEDGNTKLVDILLGKGLSEENRTKRIPLLPVNNPLDKNNLLVAIQKLATPIAGVAADVSQTERLKIVKSLVEQQFIGNGQSRFDVQTAAVSRLAVSALMKNLPTPNTVQQLTVVAFFLSMEPGVRPKGQDVNQAEYQTIVTALERTARIATLKAPDSPRLLADEKYEPPQKP